MKDFAREGAELIKAAGADYGDIRILRLEEESIEVKNRVTEGLSRRETLGFGIRLLKDGSWGFAASSGLTRRALEKTVRLALRVARSSRAASGKGVSLALCEGVVATYRTAIEKDPFKVPLEEKLALLTQSTEILSRESKVKLSQAFYDGFRTHKVLATTGGSLIEQEIIECGAGIAADAARDGI